MEQGLKPVFLTAVPGAPPAAVDERNGQIFISPAVGKRMRRQGMLFSTVDVYIDGRWRQQIIGADFTRP